MMIRKTHFAHGVASDAVFSNCGLYRYRLGRRWAEGPLIAYIMLLPAGGTEAIEDIAEGRCYRRSVALGFGAMVVLNLFAYRNKNRSELFAMIAPVGPDNDNVIMESCIEADQVVCAWGEWGRHMGRDRIVASNLLGAGIDLYNLGLTRSGVPRQLLTVKDSVVPGLWQAAAV